MTRPILLAFVRDRLAAMAERPSAWASSQEAFILQLVLLAEISHVGTPERFADRRQAMLTELSGPGTGYEVPSDPVTRELATLAVQVARRYVIP